MIMNVLIACGAFLAMAVKAAPLCNMAAKDVLIVLDGSGHISPNRKWAAQQTVAKQIIDTLDVGSGAIGWVYTFAAVRGMPA